MGRDEALGTLLFPVLPSNRWYATIGLAMGPVLAKIGRWCGTVALIVSTLAAVYAVARAKFESSTVVPAIFVVLTTLVFYLIALAPTFLQQFTSLIQRLPTYSVFVYVTPDKLYRAVTDALANDVHVKTGSGVIRHGALHGAAGGSVSQRRHSGFYKAFDDQFDECTKRSGPGSWEVRQMFIVPDESRFDMVLGYLNRPAAQKANGYWVRVVLPPFPIPYLSPLVVGTAEAFLAFDDPSFYRVKAGFHFKGENFVALLTDYFDNQWSCAAFEVRSGTKLNEDAIQRVRRRLRETVPPSAEQSLP